MVLGLATSHRGNGKTWLGRYVDPASRIDITECHSRLRWLQNYDIPCSPLLLSSLWRMNSEKHNVHSLWRMNSENITCIVIKCPVVVFCMWIAVYTHTKAFTWKANSERLPNEASRSRQYKQRWTHSKMKFMLGIRCIRTCIFMDRSFQRRHSEVAACRASRPRRSKKSR